MSSHLTLTFIPQPVLRNFHPELSDIIVLQFWQFWRLFSIVDSIMTYLTSEHLMLVSFQYFSHTLPPYIARSPFFTVCRFVHISLYVLEERKRVYSNQVKSIVHVSLPTSFSLYLYVDISVHTRICLSPT